MNLTQTLDMHINCSQSAESVPGPTLHELERVAVKPHMWASFVELELFEPDDLTVQDVVAWQEFVSMCLTPVAKAEIEQEILDTSNLNVGREGPDATRFASLCAAVGKITPVDVMNIRDGDLSSLVCVANNWEQTAAQVDSAVDSADEANDDIFEQAPAARSM